MILAVSSATIRIQLASFKPDGVRPDEVVFAGRGLNEGVRGQFEHF